MYDKNIIIIRTCTNWFQNGDFDY